MKKFYFVLILLISLFSQAQIALVKDIQTGIANSTPTNLFDYNGTLLFRSNDGVDGVELWKSDGTTANTVLVKNIATGLTNSNPSGFISMGGNVFFNATTGTTADGQELWKTDGTNAGTAIVKDINVGTASSNPSNFLLFNPTTILFSASNGVDGVELWKSDGTNAGTTIVKNYTNATGSISFNVLMNGVSYQAQIADNGREIHKSDATTVGSDIVKDIFAGNSNGLGSPDFFVSSSNNLYFSGNDGTISNSGNELWKSDGTAAGTVLIKDINIGTGNSSPRRFVEIGNTVYFNATDGTTSGVELFKTDGTALGTSIVSDINVGAGNSNPDQLKVIDGILYFFAQDDAVNYDLYKFDGTTLTKLADLNAPASSVSTDFIKIGTKILFAADGTDADTTRELWITDGTASGTQQVFTAFGGLNPTNVNNLTLSGTNLFFSATEATAGLELYKFDSAILSLDNVTFQNNIQIYPNPTKGLFTVDFAFTAPANYTISDSLGKTISKGKIENNTINFSAEKGVYFIKIESDNQIAFKKIIKE